MITVIVAVVVATAAFFGGMKYQQSQATLNTNFAANGQFGGPNGTGRGQGRFGNGNGRGGAVIGEVVSMDANSITVKMQDGSSKIVNTSGSTTVSKTDTGTLSDIKTGGRIAVFGSANSDGSVTAQNIQLNPAFRGMEGTPVPNGNSR